MLVLSKATALVCSREATPVASAKHVAARVRPGAAINRGRAQANTAQRRIVSCESGAAASKVWMQSLVESAPNEDLSPSVLTLICLAVSHTLVSKLDGWFIRDLLSNPFV